MIDHEPGWYLEWEFDGPEEIDRIPKSGDIVYCATNSGGTRPVIVTKVSHIMSLSERRRYRIEYVSDPCGTI